MSTVVKVLLFVRRVGPYHHARFQSVHNLELVVIETRPDSQEYEWRFKADANYVLKQFPKSPNPEKGIRGNQLKKTLIELFAIHEPDVIVTTGWADPEYHAAVLQAIKKNIPRVVISDSRYEDESRRFYKEWIKKLILKSYSAALVAGTASRNYLIRLGVISDDIFKPWDVVDNDYFLSQNPAFLSFVERDFICVSRFIEKKNLERLIAAFALYKNEGGKRNLKLLGSGAQELKLKQKVKDLNLESNITFEGFVQYGELPSYLIHGFCLILPSISDQWGLVVNEAMASGLPVLISENCGCAQDIVKEGKNGFIFDPFSEAAIEKAMNRLDELTNKQWTEMGAASKKIICDWNLNDFAIALTSAVNQATVKKIPIGLSVIHFLLSK